MGKPGQPAKEPPPQTGSKARPVPAEVEEDEVEDGDIATPKCDDEGDDDEPL